MFRTFPFVILVTALAMSGCKSFEPLEQDFFLGDFLSAEPGRKKPIQTYPVLIFRTPGYGMWETQNAQLTIHDDSLSLATGEVQVVRLPQGRHRFSVRPEEGGLEYCELEVAVDGFAVSTPPFVEIFERQNPTGRLLSMILAEVEATMKYPHQQNLMCLGRFGLRHGTLPPGTDLDRPPIVNEIGD